MIKLMEKISVRKDYYEKYTQDLGLVRSECMYQVYHFYLGGMNKTLNLLLSSLHL